ncbi:hypothetical protein CesoFtcFv8_013158 [Champsocephalus esox]|uniref:Uncharacterized protein n=1 Tax=Champsocephalus esox TaxID=159716 RepID=A0AAN8GW85_9TELE|nr:hypothetical protein CesoFtcFv8_013158 [Champsocephalus esox]
MYLLRPFFFSPLLCLDRHFLPFPKPPFFPFIPLNSPAVGVASGLGVLWRYERRLRLLGVMDGTGGRLYCSSCHAAASQSQSLGCKMERGSPGRGDSQDITVKGFVVTRCY